MSRDDSLACQSALLGADSRASTVEGALGLLSDGQGLVVRCLRAVAALAFACLASGCLTGADEETRATEFLKQARNGECPGALGLEAMANEDSPVGALYLASLLERGPQSGCSVRLLESRRLLEFAGSAHAQADAAARGTSDVRAGETDVWRTAGDLRSDTEARTALAAPLLLAGRLLMQAQAREAASKHLLLIVRSDAGGCADQAKAILRGGKPASRAGAEPTSSAPRPFEGCRTMEDDAGAGALFQAAIAGQCGAVSELQGLASGRQLTRAEARTAAAAAVRLAVLWELGASGRCDPADLRLAELYEVASRDFPVAHFNGALALLRLGQGAQAEAKLRLAAEKCAKCEPRALVKLAQVFERGAAGVPASEAMTTHWYHLASEAGDVHARVKLAERLLLGLGVPADVPRAQRLLDSAASRGSLEARLLLFRLSSADRPGAPAQPEVAAKWLGSAALLDASLSATFEEFLAQLSEPAQHLVRDEIDRFAAATRNVWRAVDYDRPLSPT
jgi:hypothetical protein